MSQLPNVCVIGAGASGIATARALSKRGMPFECYERAERIGGACLSAPDMPIGISRERLDLPDWPMPKSYPVFPRRRHLAAYLHDYAERFALLSHVQLRTVVEAVSPAPGGSWEVKLGGGERRIFDAVVVATGSRSAPHRPDPLPPGEFAGEQLCLHDYRDDSVLRGRDVVVVGAGPSACEIAVAASYVARSIQLAVADPPYLVPLTLLGRPYDQLPGLGMLRVDRDRSAARSRRSSRLLRRYALTAAYRIWLSPRLHGLEPPRRLLGPGGAVPAPGLLDRLLHGRVAVRPGVDCLEPDGVRFADGTRASADLVVWCTGDRTDLSPQEAAAQAERTAGRLAGRRSLLGRRGRGAT